VQLLVSAWSSNLVLIRFIVLEILWFLYFVLLPWNCLFTPILREFWGIFPPKRPSLHGNTLFEPWSVKIGPAVQPRRRIEKKGKDRTRQSKKSQGGNILPIWREAPTVLIETQICMGVNLAEEIMCAKFQDDIFRGYNFTGGGVEFPIFLVIFAWTLQQCSAIALPVMPILVQFGWVGIPHK